MKDTGVNSRLSVIYKFPISPTQNNTRSSSTDEQRVFFISKNSTILLVPVKQSSSSCPEINSSCFSVIAANGPDMPEALIADTLPAFPLVRRP